MATPKKKAAPVAKKSPAKKSGAKKVIAVKKSLNLFINLHWLKNLLSQKQKKQYPNNWQKHPSLKNRPLPPRSWRQNQKMHPLWLRSRNQQPNRKSPNSTLLKRRRSHRLLISTSTMPQPGLPTRSQAVSIRLRTESGGTSARMGPQMGPQGSTQRV